MKVWLLRLGYIASLLLGPWTSGALAAGALPKERGRSHKIFDQIAALAREPHLTVAHVEHAAAP
jgi:hypothetical protein